MSVHLQREIDSLKKDVLSLCAIVEDQVHIAVTSLLEGNPAEAEQVKRKDVEVDALEVEVEEKCLQVLALHQPVAVDLRLIVAVLKINNDLERIGDLAVNIANKSIAFNKAKAMEIPFDLAGMWAKTQAMLRDSLDAMVNLDTDLANDVCGRDDEVDQMKHDIRIEAEQMIRQDPDRTDPLMRLMAVSRNLERIADCATNIAEDVIYITEGRIVRHGEGE